MMKKHRGPKVVLTRDVETFGGTLQAGRVMELVRVTLATPGGGPELHCGDPSCFRFVDDAASEAASGRVSETATRLAGEPDGNPLDGLSIDL